MGNGKSIIGVLAMAILFSLGFGLPGNLEKKVHKEVEKFFEISEFTMTPVTIPNDINSLLLVKMTADNFFRLSDGINEMGYVFVDKASSKTAKFDYMVVFDNELKVVHSKVLIYREEYGGEIGSKRWLKQFLGKTGEDRVDHETNIDGISGATISVRSMTNSMDKLLQTIGVLQENKAL